MVEVEYSHTIPEQGDPVVEWSFIVTLKGSQRGHHYHKEFDEYIMFVEGNGVYLELQTMVLRSLLLLLLVTVYTFPKNVAHTFIPMADC